MKKIKDKSIKEKIAFEVFWEKISLDLKCRRPSDFLEKRKFKKCYKQVPPLSNVINFFQSVIYLKANVWPT